MKVGSGLGLMRGGHLSLWDLEKTALEALEITSSGTAADDATSLTGSPERISDSLPSPPAPSSGNGLMNSSLEAYSMSQGDAGAGGDYISGIKHEHAPRSRTEKYTSEIPGEPGGSWALLQQQLSGMQKEVNRLSQRQELDSLRISGRKEVLRSSSIPGHVPRAVDVTVRNTCSSGSSLVRTPRKNLNGTRPPDNLSVTRLPENRGVQRLQSTPENCGVQRLQSTPVNWEPRIPVFTCEQQAPGGPPIGSVAVPRPQTVEKALPSQWSARGPSVPRRNDYATPTEAQVPSPLSSPSPRQAGKLTNGKPTVARSQRVPQPSSTAIEVTVSPRGLSPQPLSPRPPSGSSQQGAALTPQNFQSLSATGPSGKTAASSEPSRHPQKQQMQQPQQQPQQQQQRSSSPLMQQKQLQQHLTTNSAINLGYPPGWLGLPPSPGANFMPQQPMGQPLGYPGFGPSSMMLQPPPTLQVGQLGALPAQLSLTGACVPAPFAMPQPVGNMVPAPMMGMVPPGTSNLPMGTQSQGADSWQPHP